MTSEANSKLRICNAAAQKAIESKPVSEEAQQHELLPDVEDISCYAFLLEGA